MTKSNKFWVAVLTVLANVARDYYGVDIGLDPTMAATLVSGIGAGLVWLVPNSA